MIHHATASAVMKTTESVARACDEHQDPGGKRNCDERPERAAGEAHTLWPVQADCREQTDRAYGAEKGCCTEHVQEERQVPPGRPDDRDHEPGFQTIRARIATTARPDAAENAIATGSSRRACNSAFVASPAAASCSASSRAA